MKESSTMLWTNAVRAFDLIWDPEMASLKRWLLRYVGIN